MSGARSFFRWSVGCLFIILVSVMVTSAVLNYRTAPVGGVDSDKKIISQSAQQNLSDLLFENEQMSTALQNEQLKVKMLENQLSEQTEKALEFEGYCNTQSALIESENLYDREQYTDSLSKLKSISDMPMSESTEKIYGKILNALDKKGYR